MTIDAGLKPEGATRGALPQSWRRRPLGRRCPDRSAIRCSAKWRSWRVCCVANRWTSSPGKRMLTVAKLTEWRDRALAGAASALKERERDDREDEIVRLKSKVGEITMDNELLSAKIAAMEAKSPLARRRSRR